MMVNENNSKRKWFLVPWDLLVSLINSQWFHIEQNWSLITTGERKRDRFFALFDLAAFLCSWIVLLTTLVLFLGEGIGVVIDWPESVKHLALGLNIASLAYAAVAWGLLLMGGFFHRGTFNKNISRIFGDLVPKENFAKTFSADFSKEMRDAFEKKLEEMIEDKYRAIYDSEQDKNEGKSEGDPVRDTLKEVAAAVAEAVADQVTQPGTSSDEKSKSSPAEERDSELQSNSDTKWRKRGISKLFSLNRLKKIGKQAMMFVEDVGKNLIKNRDGKNNNSCSGFQPPFGSEDDKWERFKKYLNEDVFSAKALQRIARECAAKVDLLQMIRKAFDERINDLELAERIKKAFWSYTNFLRVGAFGYGICSYYFFHVCLPYCFEQFFPG